MTQDFKNQESRLKPTQQERMQILCLYAPNTGFYSDANSAPKKFYGIDLRPGEGWHFRSGTTGVFHDVDNVSVPLKPLGRISGEECVYAYNMLFTGEEMNYSEKIKIIKCALGQMRVIEFDERYDS